jgi:hypothetical protein
MLLVAIVAAIALTLRAQGHKAQTRPSRSPSRRKDRVRMVKMPARKAK